MLLRLLAAACLVAVVAACFGWIAANPLPSYYDEALYANSAINDVAATHSRGARGFLDAYWHVDPLRPPAERLLVFPLTIVFGQHLFLLRTISVLGFIAAALWLAATIRRVSGEDAAA